MALAETGPGVFLLGTGKNLIFPRDALSRLSGALTEPEWERAAAKVIGYSVRQGGVWCAVAWWRMVEDLLKAGDSPPMYKRCLEEMAAEGLIIITRRRKYWRPVNWILKCFEPVVVFPTVLLLDTISKRGQK